MSTKVIDYGTPKASDDETELSVLTKNMSMLSLSAKSNEHEQIIQCDCDGDGDGDANLRNLRSLISRKKLHLVLDLDHTLVHAVEIRNLTPNDQRCLRHKSRQNWVNQGKLFVFNYFHNFYVIKIRPNVGAFLKEVSTMFDLSIFTLGVKGYANEMVKILDPKGLYISPSNVFAAEDCTTPRVKGLNVVNQHERVTLVVDDKKRVWVDHIKNVIEIKPYMFFDSMRHDKSDRWLQVRGDESEKHGELARVLNDLKKIYVAFFDMEANQADYESRDVRDVFEDVRKNSRLLK